MTLAVDWHSHIASRFDAGYRTSRLARERLDVWADFMGRFVTPGARVLDAGCGSGIMAYMAARLAGHVVGFDGSPEMVAICRRKEQEVGASNVKFEQAMLSDIERFGRSAFDVVLSSSVLEYVDDLEGALVGMAEALAPGGILLVSMPNGASPYRHLERWFHRMTGRPRYFTFVRHTPTAGRMAQAVRAAGLEPVERRFYADVLRRGTGKAGIVTGALYILACRKPA